MFNDAQKPIRRICMPQRNVKVTHCFEQSAACQESLRHITWQGLRDAMISKPLGFFLQFRNPKVLNVSYTEDKFRTSFKAIHLTR